MSFRDYPIATRVLIDGVAAYAGGPDSSDGKPTILDGLSFTWGRTNSIQQPEVGTCTFTMHVAVTDDVPPMLDVLRVNSTVEVWVDITQPDGTTVSELSWSGAVTSAVGQAVGYSGVEISVTASDPAAPLADETIGDNPWSVESAIARAQRILQLAQTDTTPIAIDDTISGIQLSYQDVDAQQVLPLLQDVANSIGGILWVAPTSSGTYLWIEDPGNRASLRQFLIDAVTGLVTITNNVPASSLLAAADLLLDNPQWSQDKSQGINSIDVQWESQGPVDPSTGQPTITDETVTVTVTPPPQIIRKQQIQTQLVSQLDAQELATRTLALVSETVGWVASGLTIDTTLLERDLPDLAYDQRLAVVSDLLDGANRLGRALTMINLPGWTPGGTMAATYIEGGTYTVTSGRWTLELNVSSPTGLGISATFADFSTTSVKVSDFDPTIKIRDAWGVAGPEYVGAGSSGFGAGMFGEQAFGV